MGIIILDPHAFVAPTQVIPYSAALLLGFKCSLGAWSGAAANMVLTIFCSFAYKAGTGLKDLFCFSKVAFQEKAFIACSHSNP